jgi:hypothetical protein
MPAAGSATTTHSTTMSGSATEVSSGATKTLSSRKRPVVLGAAIAGVGLVVVVVAMLLKPGASTGSGPATTPAVVTATPTPTPTPANPAVAAVENPTTTETAPKGEPSKETPKEEPKVEAPARPVVVEVSSEPSGAEVWLPSDSEARGHTPYKVALDPNAGLTHAVLKAHGYADKRIDIDPSKPEPLSIKLDRVAQNRDHDRDRDHTATKRKTTESGETKPNKGEGKPNKDGYRMMGD